MYVTREYDHLIFLQKFYPSSYLFVYNSYENNVVGLIHTTPESEDTTESEIQDEGDVDTMRYDMMEAMEFENFNICNDYHFRFGEEHEMDDDT